MRDAKALATDGDRYTSDSMICSTCRSLLVRPHEPASHKVGTRYEFSSLVQSTKQGCPICELFYLHVKRCQPVPEECCIEGFLRCDAPNEEDNCATWLPTAIGCATGRKDGYDLEIHLLPVLSYGSVTKIKEKDDTIAVSTPLRGTNTQDDVCLEQAITWLRDCITNHKDCKVSTHPPNTAIHPARLLDVSGPDLRVVTVASISQKADLSYMTLSHRWNHSTMPKLLESNIIRMQHSINS
jgi:hypothetical protein